RCFQIGCLKYDSIDALEVLQHVNRLVYKLIKAGSGLEFNVKQAIVESVQRISQRRNFTTSAIVTYRREVMRSDLRKGHIRYQAIAGSSCFNSTPLVVVIDNNYAILRQSDVRFDTVSTEADCSLKSEDGVFC